MLPLHSSHQLNIAAHWLEQLVIVHVNVAKHFAENLDVLRWAAKQLLGSHIVPHLVPGRLSAELLKKLVPLPIAALFSIIVAMESTGVRLDQIILVAVQMDHGGIRTHQVAVGFLKVIVNIIGEEFVREEATTMTCIWQVVCVASCLLHSPEETKEATRLHVQIIGDVDMLLEGLIDFKLEFVVGALRVRNGMVPKQCALVLYQCLVWCIQRFVTTEWLPHTDDAWMSIHGQA